MLNLIIIWALFLQPVSLPVVMCRVLLPEISGVYEGSCRDGLAHGIGKATGVDIYIGRFRKGLPHGTGRYTWANGNFYEGEWIKGMQEGKGIYHDVIRDTTIKGFWRKGELVRPESQYPPGEINYMLTMRRNIDRIRFYRFGEGNRVIFNFNDQSGRRPAQKLHIDGSSGSYYSSGGEIGFRNVQFPFKGNIRFQALSKMRTGIVNYQLQFTIVEPGLWELTVTY